LVVKLGGSAGREGDPLYPIDKSTLRCPERLSVARRVFANRSYPMPQEPCGQGHCRRYFMTLREFGRLGGETWDMAFRSKLGKAASKLYREIYGKDPPLSPALALLAALSPPTPDRA
jgi:hypothetical protein